jgi:hypothetical protein
VHHPYGRNPSDQISRNAGGDVLGLPQRRIPDENVEPAALPIHSTSMDNRDFLDGIDEQFQRLMKQQGNGKGNGRARTPAAPAQSVTASIIEQISDLTHSQREEVLAFIKSLKHKVDE